MATKLKNSCNIGRLIIVLVLALCSAGMMMTYRWTSDELDSYVPARADAEYVLSSMSDNLSAGNYIMNKDVYGDLVFANLTADILLKLSDGICDHISDGGYLIISGIIDSREEEVLKRYLDLGLKLVDKMSMKDWRAFKFQKQ